MPARLRSRRQESVSEREGKATTINLSDDIVSYSTLGPNEDVYWTYLASIADYHRDRRRFKYCRHIKQYFEPNLCTWEFDMRSKDHVKTVVWNNRCTPFQNEIQKELLKLVPSGVDHNECQVHIEAMKPSMESGLNLAVFAAELRDLKTLFEWFQKDGESIRRLISSRYLMYNFGWKPFMQDLYKACKGLLNFEKKLSDYIAGAGRPQKRHAASKAVTDSIFMEFEKPLRFDGLQDVKVCQVIGSASSKMMSTMEYIYSIPELSDTERRIRALLDTLGLYGDLASYWELVRLSFVVDWFVDIGSFLEQFRTRYLPATLDIKNFCFTRKTTITAREYQKLYPELGSGDWHFVGTYTIKAYERVPVKIEDRHFLPSIDGLVTIRRFLLGAALVEQRLPDVPRHRR